MRRDVQILEEHADQQAYALPSARPSVTNPQLAVSVLTGGSDRPYVFGLTTSLMSKHLLLDLIGSDELAFPEFRSMSGVNFLNLRGSSERDVSIGRKVLRVATYYKKLIGYASTAKPRLFHILWNNKFEFFDRTLLMLYYRLLDKRIVLTVHNVNANKRDLNDTRMNRLTLRIQYRLAHHIFVHTERMKRELLEDFGLDSGRVTVIPFGINNAVPNTALTPDAAKERLGLRKGEKVLLFFGRITPYKGLEYLIDAFRQIVASDHNYRLLIAGRPDNCEKYWSALREEIQEEVRSGRVVLNADFIPDEDTEAYFKAADAVILPYRHIYQSGVLFLGHSFGLPVLVADVGSLKDDIVEGENGYSFRAEDPVDMARAINEYFASDLYADLDSRRQQIQNYANERHSWEAVAEITTSVYAGLLRIPSPGICRASRSA